MSGFKSGVNAGYFECYMNTWATADKVDLLMGHLAFDEIPH